MAKKRDRKEYFREWYRKNKERHNAAVKDRYKKDPEKHIARVIRYKAYMTDAQREKVRARDRIYHSRRRDLAKARYEKNKESIAIKTHERYIRNRKLARKRDPVATAKRLLEKAKQLAQYGYHGKLQSSHYT